MARGRLITGTEGRLLRESIPISTNNFAALAEIGQGGLSRWERNQLGFSPKAVERLQRTLLRLLALKRLFGDVPIDYSDVPKIRRMLAAFDQAAPQRQAGREEARA